MDMNRRTFSENLCTILDNIGFTKQFRRWSLEAVKTREMLVPVVTGFGTPNNLMAVRYEAGSSVDGTFRFSLNSDLDWLFVIQAFSIGEDVEFDVAYFIVTNEDTLPGYVKLKANQWAKCIQENVYYCSYVNEVGDEYLTNQPKNTHLFNIQQYASERSGPALTTTGEFSSTDNVYALRSRAWPKVAQEWFQRPRYHGWPPADSIEAFRTMDCFAVPTGHPHSKGTKRHELEWRLSFTRQERHLMVNLTDVQYKCYVLLKMIKEDIITPFMGKSLSSYHCKTSLFYTIEEHKPGIWIRENLTECVCKCLRRLLDWAEKDFCPNYFLPQSNLFHGKINSKEMSKLVEILRKTLRNICESLEVIHCERLGEWMRYINSNACDSDREKGLQASANTSLSITVSCLINTVATLVTSIFRESLQFSLTVGVVGGHLQSLQILYSQYSEIDSNLRESLIPAIAYLHSSLASHLASLSTYALPAVKDWYVCASALHFMHATGLEAIISRLKLATVLYMTGYSHSAKQVLTEMTQNMKAVEIFGGLEPRWLVRERYNQNILLHCEIKEVIQMPISQVLKMFSAGPVIFLPTEMYMTPHALRFEMFRSVATPSWDNIVASVLYRYYYGWAVVEAEIYYHFLCTQTGLYNGYAEFIKNGYDLKRHNHHETWWNIIGWVAKQSNCFHSAAVAFLQSWLVYHMQKERSGKLHVVDDNQYLHNAAKLHMLVLLYDIWKNDYSLENAARTRTFMETASRNPELLDLLNRICIPDLFER